MRFLLPAVSILALGSCLFEPDLDGGGDRYFPCIDGTCPPPCTCIGNICAPPGRLDDPVICAGCQDGMADCDGSTRTRCETDTRSDRDHCGGCGVRCPDGQDCVDGDCSGCADGDGDGHADASCGGDDCDDSDPGTHPGAAEICGDGIDQDCSGVDLDCDCSDSDHDGHFEAGCGGDDCDDGNRRIFPGIEESPCDGIDRNCNGFSDEAPDEDGDGFDVCGIYDIYNPDGRPADCDDSSVDIHPDAIEYCGDGIDQDCSGKASDPDSDGDGHVDAWDLNGDRCSGRDCAPSDPRIHPGAAEIPCDGIDQNCNGMDDEAPDADGDGYDVCGPGDAIDPDNKPADCADWADWIHPGDATGELCESGDLLDEDCDGRINCADEDCALVADCQGCQDGDGDGYTACDGDCDDAIAARHPGAYDLCGDDLDQDCSSLPNDPDLDGDGFVAAVDLAGNPCAGGTDCDDLDAMAFPGAIELCGNDSDEDCSGQIDDLDLDADGYAMGDLGCGGTDCNDLDGEVHPGALEDCHDGVDNDCDERIDCADPYCQIADESCFGECPDQDQDGFAPCGDFADCDDAAAQSYPGAIEVCDGLDNDCDEDADESLIMTVSNASIHCESIDGPLESAGFNQPAGMAWTLDYSVLYLADSGGGRIRSIHRSDRDEWEVETVLGSEFGLVQPTDLLHVPGDGSGILFVSDPPVDTVWIVDLDDVDGGRLEYQNGSPIAFRAPRGLAMDWYGRLYVADSGNGCIRRVSVDTRGYPALTVETFAGACDSENSELQAPAGLAFMLDGGFLVSDIGDGSIKYVSSSGDVLVVVAPGEFNHPIGLAVDWISGGIYISDPLQHRVARIGPGGVWTVAGLGNDQSDLCPACEALLLSPTGLAPLAGTVFVSDIEDCHLRLIADPGS
ncbi:MAG: hypothetical protein JXR96_19190 [Deltaproteobacteria bacterium]|nr:hypothetical protein [Deltaproteobacteria bacterium]